MRVAAPSLHEPPPHPAVDPRPTRASSVERRRDQRAQPQPCVAAHAVHSQAVSIARAEAAASAPHSSKPCPSARAPPPTDSRSRASHQPAPEPRLRARPSPSRQMRPRASQRDAPPPPSLEPDRVSPAVSSGGGEGTPPSSGDSTRTQLPAFIDAHGAKAKTGKKQKVGGSSKAPEASEPEKQVLETLEVPIRNPEDPTDQPDDPPP
nr:translation initiation factor IF-2-like [Aegilops tauschii subsp. strangulata]